MSKGLGIMTGKDRQDVDVHTFWNGEATYCEQVWIVRDGAKTAAVLVSYHDDDSFLLDDRGQGWAKVTNGFGSPRYGHQNIMPDDGTIVSNRA